MNRALIFIFIITNLLLYFFSYNGATFIEGADASQYYLPAISFIEYGQFMVGSTPLTFGPPLYSIFLSIPIGIFGIDNSDFAIVILQASLLFFTGYVFKLIFLMLYSGHLRSNYAVLLHALVVLNPNSLITAHLVQSETLFTFLFSIATLFTAKLFSDFSFKNLALIGFFMGLSTLTRPVGLYFLIALPVFLLIVFKLKNKKNSVSRLFIPLLVGVMTISPWYVRNYIEFDKFFFTSNTSTYLRAQYTQLKHKGSGWPRIKAEKLHDKQFIKYYNNSDKNTCLDRNDFFTCKRIQSNLSIKLILNEPLKVHIKSLIDSWATLFFSGGASNIRNYLGIEGKNAIVGFQTRSFRGFDSIKDLFNEMNLSYMLIFIFTMSFAVVTRVIGIFGIFYMIKERKITAYVALLFMEIIFLFTAAYLYLGQSRFRVPFDPILMLFAVFGLIYFYNGKDKVK